MFQRLLPRTIRLPLVFPPPVPILNPPFETAPVFGVKLLAGPGVGTGVALNPPRDDGAIEFGTDPKLPDPNPLFGKADTG